jgi:hypothetical protein
MLLFLTDASPLHVSLCRAPPVWAPPENTWPALRSSHAQPHGVPAPVAQATSSAQAQAPHIGAPLPPTHALSQQAQAPRIGAPLYLHSAHHISAPLPLPFKSALNWDWDPDIRPRSVTLRNASHSSSEMSAPEVALSHALVYVVCLLSYAQRIRAVRPLLEP